MDTTSTAHPPSARNPQQASREASARTQRGLALFRAGAVQVHGDAFVVAGSARNYTVWLHDGEPSCDCPDYRRHHATCKHGYAVLVASAHRRCRSEAPARPARDRRRAHRGSDIARQGQVTRRQADKFTWHEGDIEIERS